MSHLGLILAGRTGENQMMLPGLSRIMPPFRLLPAWRRAACLVLALGLVLGGLGAQEYFEAPEAIDNGNARFSRVVDSRGRLVLVYQDLVNQESLGSFTMGTIRIACRLLDAAGRPGPETVLVDNIQFSSNTAVPPVFSVASGSAGWITLVYAPPSAPQASVLRFAPDPAGTVRVEELGSISARLAVSSLRLYFREDGSGIILATQGTGNSFSVQTSVSADGLAWSDFAASDQDLEKNVNLNPAYARLGGRDYLVFQSRDFRLMEELGTSTYQLYLKESTDGGRTWSAGRIITDFVDPGDNPGRNRHNAYDNQRPFLAADGRDLVLLWERGLGRASRQVRYQRLTAKGERSGEALKLSNLSSGGFSPEWLRRGRQEVITWFSSQGLGSRVWLSRRQEGEAGFETRLVSGDLDEASYPTVADSRTGLQLFFHGRSARTPKTASRVFHVAPDTTASPPRLVPLNFSPDSTGLRRELSLRLEGRPDASGIAGFNLVLSQDPAAPVPAQLNYQAGAQPLLPALDQDGAWYLLARAVDRAGNWSGVERLRYNLDSTPPAAPEFIPPQLDENGRLVSNSFTLSWTHQDPADVRSWQYSLQYLGQPASFDPLAFLQGLQAVPVLGEQAGTSLRRSNVENGWYLAAVWARDQVGNTSPPAYLFLQADKFIPSTQISFLDLGEDAFGNRSLNIQGRGFTANGSIRRIVLDRDGLPPWDHEYLVARQAYVIAGDRQIRGLALDNVPTASYLLGLEHTERGMSFAARRLDLEQRGIIKYGDFTLNDPGRFSLDSFKPWRVQSGSVTLWIVLLILAILIPVSALQLRGIVREFALIDTTARALLQGRPSPLLLRAGKVRSMNIRILGLRVKFTVFFLALVIAVVLLISLPLSQYTIANQRTILAKGLQDRLQVMMESVASSAANFLKQPDNYTLELRQLANQGKAMEEIRYITITGLERDNPANPDAVWATSDEVLLGGTAASGQPAGQTVPAVLERRLDSADFIAGKSSIKDALSPWVAEHQPAFDQQARSELGSIPADIASFTEQYGSLLLNKSPEARKELERIDSISATLRERMIATLDRIAGGMQSLPAYNAAAFDPATQDYIFYRLIYFRVASEAPEQARYYRGMVRIGVSTTTIVRQIEATLEDIRNNILIFALIALGSGLVGAIILSSIIVVPIRRLVRGVEQIKDIITLDVASQDKRFGEFLADSPLKTRSRDEIATLSTAISDMVYSLKKGAETNKDLVAGKDIQKMFIPLEKVGKGKGTTGRSKTAHSELFGYYEGAKGVSGDYFYYQKISDEVYACIKCDISGKGIPAALIMVEVATLFMSHFEDWERRKPEREAKRRLAGNEGDLVPLVRTINDLVAGREFGSKFAAFNIALFNEKTGQLAFCNAGDNQVHIYRDRSKTVESMTITKTPAAGMFSSDMFPPNMKYKEDHAVLHFGDILLMFTDGVEESQIYYRSPDLQLSPATEEDIKNGDVPDYCTPGRIDEEFGLERIRAVVAAAQNKGTYELRRSRKTAFSDTPATFDFSALGNSAEETVLALVCVEKIFRLIPDPAATEQDRIRIDKTVDDFMARVFVQYRTHFRFPREDYKDDLYREYSHLKEEAQFDDLTLLALRKC